jgi:hypothetical protein
MMGRGTPTAQRRIDRMVGLELACGFGDLQPRSADSGFELKLGARD